MKTPTPSAPINRSDALQWLAENVKDWPEVGGALPPPPDGWSWVFINGHVVCECLSSQINRHITKDDWSHSRGVVAAPMPATREAATAPTPAALTVSPVVGQWYRINGDTYQVNYVGAELVVVADANGDEDAVGLDEFENLTPCERPKTQYEIILDEFNEWRGKQWLGTHPISITESIDGVTTRVSYMIDFIIDRDSKK